MRESMKKLQEQREKWAATKRKNLVKKKKSLKKQKEFGVARTEAQKQTARTNDFTELFNLAVLQQMVQGMRALPEEGIWLSVGQLQQFMQNTAELIDQHTQVILL